MHSIAAKAVAFGEALKPEFTSYAEQVVANAAALANALNAKGFKLVTGGTSNHLLLVNVYDSFGLDGNVVETALDKIGLTLNKNAIPDDPLPPFRPSGIRLGTPAITTRGLKETDMERVAEWMKQAIDNHDNEEQLSSLRQSVITFASQFPLPSDNHR
jgi:glycine hydroxymethyltransferase